MSVFDELLTRVGVPGLMIAFAAVVWSEIQTHRQDIRDLWALTNGKDGHSEKIARIEGRMEKHR